MSEIERYEVFEPEEEGNPYRIEYLELEGQEDAYMRLTPPVTNIDGFFRWAENTWSTKFRMEQITRESTILNVIIEGWAADHEPTPEDFVRHMPDVREAARTLLHQLGAGVNEDLFKGIDDYDHVYE